MTLSEDQVRAHLQSEFKQTFTEKKLEVGHRVKGEAAYKRFDAVSDDGKIVAMVKDYSATNLNGNRTRLARVLQDMVYLHLAEASRKFMYLSPAFFDWFSKVGDGSVIPGIEVRCIPQSQD